jgi:hypothetical protein
VKTILILSFALWLVGARADEERASERCALCHEPATQEWRSSKHSQAVGESFLAVWKQQGEKWECLVCHSSRYDRNAGTFSHEGVSCESCHGAINEKHPDEAKMTLPVSSEVCQSCHSITYGEWRVSRHGQKNIRCFDCHKMHGMQLRKDDPDQMCGTCHTERLKDFSHATHHIKGVRCINCHMPETVGAHLKIKGTGTRGHSFGVGAETCAGCHREMVHVSHEHASLEQELAELKAHTPESLRAELEEVKRDNRALRDSLRANRRVFPIIAVVAFGLGMVIEFALLHRRSKKGAK